ncbi:MAG: PKD domain-containing protein [Thermoplasmatota archaeon]
MEIKFVAILIIAILITAVISISFCPVSKENTLPFVKVFANVTSGRSPLNVSFSCNFFNFKDNTSEFHWDFGDGDTSTEASSNHTYSWGGKFYPTVTIWFENGNSISDTLEINVFEYFIPCAVISAYGICGKPPLTVSFTGGGYDPDGQIVEYGWDFDDGSSSTEKDPIHTYDKIGIYYVRLTVRDNDGQQGSDSLEIHVIENHVPQASVSADITEGKAPLKVNFYGSCSDIDDLNISYHYVFENTILLSNRESDQQNASHIFWSPGVYNVTLTVTDEDDATDKVVVQITVHESLFSRGLRLSIRTFISNHIPNNKGDIIDRLIGYYIAKYLV